MGNVEHKAIPYPYKASEKQEQGMVVVVNELNGKQYGLKSLHPTSKKQFESYLKLLREWIKSSSSYVLKIVDIIEEIQETVCTEQYRILIIYEHSSQNMEKFIQKKQAYRKDKLTQQSYYLSHNQILYIMGVCLNVLNNFQEIAILAEKYNIAPLCAPFITAKDILICSQQIKIRDIFMLQQQQDYLLEPSSSLYTANYKQFIMFRLGMTLLEISILQQLDDCYKQGIDQQQEIEKKLLKARNIYGRQSQSSHINCFDLIQAMIRPKTGKKLSIGQALKLFQTTAQETHKSTYPSTARFHLEIVSPSKNKKHRETTHYQTRQQTITLSNLPFLQSQTLSPFVKPFDPKENNLQGSALGQSLQISNNLFNQMGSSLIDQITSHRQHYQVSQFTTEHVKLFTDPQLLQTIRRTLGQFQYSKQCEKDGKGIRLNHSVYLQ